MACGDEICHTIHCMALVTSIHRSVLAFLCKSGNQFPRNIQVLSPQLLKQQRNFSVLVLWCNNAGFALAVRICDWWNKCSMPTVLCVYWRLHWSVNFVLVIIEGARVLWMGDLTARSVVHAIGRRSSDKSTHFAVVPSVWHHHYACTGFVGGRELGTGLTTWLHCGSFPFSDSVENIIDFMKPLSNSCLSLGFFSWMASNMLW